MWEKQDGINFKTKPDAEIMSESRTAKTVEMESVQWRKYRIKR